MKTVLTLPILALALSAACQQRPAPQAAPYAAAVQTTQPRPQPATTMQTATFGNGCFWCTEAIFQDLKGVTKVESGYSGGTVANPTYEQVCSGSTGHAEVIQIAFDPSVISYAELLEVFWNTHDPTTLNRQGNDVGTQYRSAVFYHDEAQRQTAEAYKAQLQQSGVFADPIVTEIVPYQSFYKAENYHQNYFKRNGNAPYCAFVIRPKVEKFRKQYGAKLRAPQQP